MNCVCEPVSCVFVVCGLVCGGVLWFCVFLGQIYRFINSSLVAYLLLEAEHSHVIQKLNCIS